MKKIALVLSVVLVVAAAGTAQTGIRPILSGQWDAYFNNDERADLTGRAFEKNVFDINGVSIFPFTPGFSLESKVQVQVTRWTPPGPDGSLTLEELEAAGGIGADWWEVTLSAAPILVRAPFYFIIRPGIALGNGVETTGTADNRIAPSYDLTVDANLETASVYANATVRGTWHQPQSIWFVIPSAGATVAFPNRIRLGGKLFWSFTRDYANGVDSTNWAGLLNTELPIDERKNLLLGGSVSWTPGSDDFDTSVFLGITFPATDTIRFKYQLEPIVRRAAGLGISNVLVMDARL